MFLAHVSKANMVLFFFLTVLCFVESVHSWVFCGFYSVKIARDPNSPHKKIKQCEDEKKDFLLLRHKQHKELSSSLSALFKNEFSIFL